MNTFWSFYRAHYAQDSSTWCTYFFAIGCEITSPWHVRTCKTYLNVKIFHPKYYQISKPMNGRIYTYLIEVSIFSLFSLLSGFWFWSWSFYSRKLFLVINTISSYHNLGNYTWKLQYHVLNARKQYDYNVMRVLPSTKLPCF